mmetsp:Transcript_25248/g.88072  ORF Transcript_25248/g.88072 Transcript_25248/m.88072 type:complete len:253 (-) Transcript_25248:525-1283(-)
MQQRRREVLRAVQDDQHRAVLAQRLAAALAGPQAPRRQRLVDAEVLVDHALRLVRNVARHLVQRATLVPDVRVLVQRRQRARQPHRNVLHALRHLRLLAARRVQVGERVGQVEREEVALDGQELDAELRDRLEVAAEAVALLVLARRLLHALLHLARGARGDADGRVAVPRRHVGQHEVGEEAGEHLLHAVLLLRRRRQHVHAPVVLQDARDVLLIRVDEVDDVEVGAALAPRLDVLDEDETGLVELEERER